MFGEQKANILAFTAFGQVTGSTRRGRGGDENLRGQDRDKVLTPGRKRDVNRVPEAAGPSGPQGCPGRVPTGRGTGHRVAPKTPGKPSVQLTRSSRRLETC